MLGGVQQVRASHLGRGVLTHTEIENRGPNIYTISDQAIGKNTSRSNLSTVSIDLSDSAI